MNLSASVSILSITNLEEGSLFYEFNFLYLEDHFNSLVPEK